MIELDKRDVKVIGRKRSNARDSKVGTSECPFRQDAGSYYDPLPWTTCSKMPNSTSNENEMCDLDAGRECRWKGKK